MVNKELKTTYHNGETYISINDLLDWTKRNIQKVIDTPMCLEIDEHEILVYKKLRKTLKNKNG